MTVRVDSRSLEAEEAVASATDSEPKIPSSGSQAVVEEAGTVTVKTGIAGNSVSVTVIETVLPGVFWESQLSVSEDVQVEEPKPESLLRPEGEPGNPELADTERALPLLNDEPAVSAVIVSVGTTGAGADSVATAMD